MYQVLLAVITQDTKRRKFSIGNLDKRYQHQFLQKTAKTTPDAGGSEPNVPGEPGQQGQPEDTSLSSVLRLQATEAVPNKV